MTTPLKIHENNPSSGCGVLQAEQQVSRHSRQSSRHENTGLYEPNGNPELVAARTLVLSLADKFPGHRIGIPRALAVIEYLSEHPETADADAILKLTLEGLRANALTAATGKRVHPDAWASGVRSGKLDSEQPDVS